MKKNILVVTFEKEAMEKYMSQLVGMFGKEIEFMEYIVLEDSPCNFDKVDMILVSCQDVTPYISEYIIRHVPVVYIMRTFEKSRTACLDGLERGSKVLVADYSESFAYETIGTLNSIGYETCNFIPYKSGDEADSDAAMCITIGNVGENLPEGMKICDIGWYSISYTTMLEITTRLEIKDRGVLERMGAYSKHVHLADYAVFDAVSSLSEIEGRWNSALNLINEGIIIINKSGTIIQCNESAALLAGDRRQGELMGKALDEAFGKSFAEFVSKRDSITNEIFEAGERNRLFAVSKKEIQLHGITKETVITVEEVSKIESKEKDIRLKQTRKGLKAKYTFGDITTESRAMIKSITAAKRVAATEMSVLITGESGVGKEMFAQAMHNISNRRSWPFVAINCAAIPEQLLESELFGYEEGAFSGAKKGGKKGIFELAHKGTIFLDEIGDMPLSTQVKLLRVLQEKEIMRIGGDAIIPVDTRIIAAANEKLEMLMENGKFRRDLYYRLGAFQIIIPPLRARKEDIIPIAKKALEKNSSKIMSPELEEALKSFSWEGNVRELINCMDYIAIMGDNVLTKEDIPEYLTKKEEYAKTSDKEEKRKPVSGDFMREEYILIEKILGILEYRNMGRRTLVKILKDNGTDISEYRLRKLLELMEKKGLIKIDRSKRGISKIRDDF